MKPNASLIFALSVFLGSSSAVKLKGTDEVITELDEVVTDLMESVSGSSVNYNAPDIAKKYEFSFNEEVELLDFTLRENEDAEEQMKRLKAIFAKAADQDLKDLTRFDMDAEYTKAFYVKVKAAYLHQNEPEVLAKLLDEENCALLIEFLILYGKDAPLHFINALLKGKTFARIMVRDFKKVLFIKIVKAVYAPIAGEERSAKIKRIISVNERLLTEEIVAGFLDKDLKQGDYLKIGEIEAIVEKKLDCVLERCDPSDVACLKAKEVFIHQNEPEILATLLDEEERGLVTEFLILNGKDASFRHLKAFLSDKQFAKEIVAKYKNSMLLEIVNAVSESKSFELPCEKNARIRKLNGRLLNEGKVNWLLGLDWGELIKIEVIEALLKEAPTVPAESYDEKSDEEESYDEQSEEES